MADLARRADAICARKTSQRLKHPLLIFVWLLASIHPAMACDGSLPPLNTLATQKALVENLQTYSKGVREEERVGQRSMYEIMDAEEEYAEELETLRAMEACNATSKKSARSRVLEARLKSASDYLASLKSWETSAEDRFQVGEVTRTDVALVRALALRAEIRLATLKKEAGQ